MDAKTRVACCLDTKAAPGLGHYLLGGLVFTSSAMVALAGLYWLARWGSNLLAAAGVANGFAQFGLAAVVIGLIVGTSAYRFR